MDLELCSHDIYTENNHKDFIDFKMNCMKFKFCGLNMSWQ